MTELKLDYICPNFGKKNSRGEYDIRTDMKKYILYVDNIPVVNINIEYERFNSKQPNYSCCYISYDNMYFNKKESKYNNKGYTTQGVQQIIEMLLSSGITPKISLNILPNNLPSKRIAEKLGFIYMNNDEYSIFHPNAIKMYEEGLEYLKEDDEEIYELQMKKNLMFIQKYLSSKKENKEETITMHS